MKRLIILCIIVAAVCCIQGCSSSDDTISYASTGVVPWIDIHCHLLGVNTSCTSRDCIDSAIQLMDQYCVRKAIFIHPPSPANAFDTTQEQLVQNAISFYPNRFFYGADGNTLNSIIQQGPDSGAVSSSLVQIFDQNFQALIDTAEMVVFGEMAVLHLSYEENHAFEEKPAG